MSVALNALIAKVLFLAVLAGSLCLSMLVPSAEAATIDGAMLDGMPVASMHFDDTTIDPHSPSDCCDEEPRMDHITDAVVTQDFAKTFAVAFAATAPLFLSADPVDTRPTAFLSSPSPHTQFSLTGIVIKRE